MHDLRPSTPQPGQVAQVNLHPEQAGHGPHPDDWAAAVPSSGTTSIPSGGNFEVSGMDPAPAPEPAPAPVPSPQQPAQMPPQPAQPQAPAAQPPPVPLPQQDEHHTALANSLRTIKFGLIGLIVILALAVAYFATQSQSNTAQPSGGSGQNAGGSASNAPSSGSPGSPHSISCTGTTGTDASTDSKTFTDVEGTECTYRTGDFPETLVLNGKLTGRNTEGTGMAATINVNGKVCTGGESLNYARTFTPMVSNCVFDVPANSAVAIKWQFLSPFGGSASVLRSSKNIAPSIVGTAIPKTEDSGGGSGE